MPVPALGGGRLRDIYDQGQSQVVSGRPGRIRLSSLLKGVGHGADGDTCAAGVGTVRNREGNNRSRQRAHLQLRAIHRRPKRRDQSGLSWDRQGSSRSRLKWWRGSDPLDFYSVSAIARAQALSLFREQDCPAGFPEIGRSDGRTQPPVSAGDSNRQAPELLPERTSRPRCPAGLPQRAS